MATITQYPNAFNSAYVPNVFTLSGLLATEDRYVLQVRSEGNTILSTFKQPPNAAGVAHFDIQRVLQSYLKPSFVENTPKVAPTPGALFRYRVWYGTETGTTQDITSQGIVYNVINAYDNWRVLNSDLTDYVPAPTSLDCETSQNTTVSYNRRFDFLTNYPGTIPVATTDIRTLSFFNMTTLGQGQQLGPNDAPFWVRITTTNGGAAADDVIYSISAANGLPIRNNCNDKVVNFTDAERIGTVGVGPVNIDPLLTQPYDAYQVRIYAYNHCNEDTIADCGDYGEILQDGYVGDLICSKQFEVTEGSCERFDPVILSFVNQYGVKDYFTFDKRNTRQTTTNRNDYTSIGSTWNAATFAINQQGRGKTTFNSVAGTTMTLQSDWMSDEVSKWLQELYQSPSVMIYIDGQWEPCNLTTQTYSQKTYARDFLFQHEVGVEFSNNQKIQRG